MARQLTWLGHGSWLLETGTHSILLDPFLNDSPTSPVKAEDLSPDYILISHGHFDHLSDAASIANRTQAPLVAIYEIAEWFQKQHGVASTVGMNLGGAVQLPFGSVKMTNALHSSQLPDGSYGGNPAGFLVKLEEVTLYFACDTALFGDMQLIGQAGIDIAVLPIGDLFTMGPDDAVAATKLIQPKRVLPAHYNTWPPIEQDAEAWAAKVREQTDAEPIVIEPGQSVSL
ncbi:MAG: metal-dependent hydrolase [Planctomycetaceae bacterium]|nr:metal-dependent hydrolase [Planctomycetaceae bacterium]